jgi:hypothetical protein
MGKGIDDLFGNSFTEVAMISLRTHVSEGKDSDRHRGTWGFGGTRFERRIDLSGLCYELMSNLWNRLEVSGPRCIVMQGISYFTDALAKHGFDDKCLGPDHLEQLILRDDTVSVSNQIQERFKGLWSKEQLLVPSHQSVERRFKREVVEAVRRTHVEFPGATLSSRSNQT